MDAKHRINKVVFTRPRQTEKTLEREPEHSSLVLTPGRTGVSLQKRLRRRRRRRRSMYQTLVQKLQYQVNILKWYK
jgi:hypothetical protein